MKRKVGKIAKIIVIVLVLGVVGCGGYWLYNKYYVQAQETAAAAYTPVSVTTGNLTQEVISTGSLSIADSEEIVAPYSVTIASVSVKAGQTVAEGEELAKVDVSSLDSAINALQTQIETVDNTLASLAKSYSSSVTVSNPVEGRVKIIYGAVGDNVQDVIAQNGCLYVLSLDGKMKVEIQADSSMALNNTVSVSSTEKTWTGTIAKISNGIATVTFSDASIAPDTEVRILRNGALLGTEKCAINMPFAVSTTTDGYISSSNLKENYTFGQRASVYTVTNVALTQDYLDAQQERQDLVDELAKVRALKNDPAVYAQTAGIINSIGVSRNTAVTKDSVMFTMYVGQPTQMIISVDELDIINVSVGQSATVVMDALTDKTYNAQVEYISQIGTASSGITSYSVTVALEGDDELKLGMNGTVTIGVGQQQNVLLVPLTALQSDAQGSYVWLYSASYQATDDAPGIKTYVTTGLSNEDYAAVTAGLSLGDQVLVVRSAASAVTTTTTQSGLGGMMDMGGGSMPSMPSDMGGGSGTGGGSGSGSGSGGGSNSNRGGGSGTMPSGGGFPGN